MRFLCVLLVLVLSGCSTVVPVAQKFPDPVPVLTKPCPDLNKIEGEKIVITDMLKVVIQNYSLYYECAVKVDGWNQWYTDQKIIFEQNNK
jgi:hypothetical protein